MTWFRPHWKSRVRRPPDPRRSAERSIDSLEEAIERLGGWTTDDLGEFWQGATEACVLRLIRLKPEMVKHVYEGDRFVE